MLATPLQASMALALPVSAGSVEAVQTTLTLAGQVITGPTVSVTVTVWSQVDVLPQLSVAVQVRVMTYLPAQLPGAVTSLWVLLATPLQVSLALALPVSAGSVEAVQTTLTLAGQVITGPTVSVTVMVWSQVDVVRQLVLAVQARVMR